LGRRADVRIVRSVDRGLGLSLLAVPEVRDLAGLRGGTVAVDVPSSGFATQNGPRAIVTSAGVKDPEAGLKLIARHAMHQLGHTWELHHCLDPRCAMYPPWTLNYDAGDTFFDTFCRDKSEQKIRLAKS